MIVHDSLIGMELLDSRARKDVELIDVGKARLRTTRRNRRRSTRSWSKRPGKGRWSSG